MKKINLFIVILSMSLFTLNVQAQAALPMPFSLKAPQVTGVKKFLGIGAVGATIVGGAIGITVSREYLISNPEKLGEYLATHPEKTAEYTEYIDNHIEKEPTEEGRQIYIRAKEYLSLGVGEIESVILEDDIVWKNIKIQVEQEIDIVNQKIENDNPDYQCNLEKVKVLLMEYNTFENTINVTLPQIQSVPTQLLNVSTYIKNYEGYAKSTNKNPPQHQDHIPSYAALEKYFNNHGVNVNVFNKKNIKIRNENLEYNSTAIALPDYVHRKGRTIAGKNTRTQIENDAYNLKAATIKDITTIAYVLNNNPQYNISPMDFIRNSMYIYARNKLLCLYDVP